MFSSGKFSNHINKSKVVYAWLMILILFFIATIGLTMAFFYNDDWGSNSLGTSGPVRIQAVGKGNVSIEDDNASKLAVTLDPQYGDVIQGGTPIDLTANCKVFYSTTNPLLRASLNIQFLDPNTDQVVSGNAVVDEYLTNMNSQLYNIIVGNGWYSYEGWYYYIGDDGEPNGGNTVLKEVQFTDSKDTVVYFINEKIHFPTSITSAYSGYKVKFIITFQGIQNFVPDDAGNKLPNTITNSLKIFEDVVSDDSGSSSDYLYEYTPDGKGIYFGYWPQTIKDSSVTLSSTPDADGYYLGSDGERYAKLITTYDGLVRLGMMNAYINIEGNVASNGTVMNLNETYFFKLEKLKWTILDIDESTNKATILCDSIIQGQEYQANYRSDNGDYYATDDDGNILTDEDGNQVYANNYKYSQLRSFLNTTFYNSAFSDMQKAIVQQIEVDNSADTTDSNTNKYACENTNDKVWSLSYKDYMNYSNNNSYNDVDYVWLILKPTTDYARATCAMTYNEVASGKSVYDILDLYDCLNGDETEDITYDECTDVQKVLIDKFYASGAWWRRSPYSGYSNYAFSIRFNGSGAYVVYYPVIGVVPALQIQL